MDSTREATEAERAWFIRQAAMATVADLPGILQKWRRDLGVSLAQLSEITGLSPHTIMHFERGDGGTRWRTVHTLIGGLYLLHQEDERG